MKFFVMIFKRTFWLYFLAAGMVLSLIDYKDVNNQIRLTTLNRFRPMSFQYLIDSANNPQKFDKKQSEQFLFYYKKVIEYIPNRADAFGMMGYCHYQLGHAAKAVKAYQAAAKIFPHFYWYYYNVGVIDFNKGDYPSAIEQLKKGLGKDVELSLKFILASMRIYLPIVILNDPSQPPDKIILQQLKDGYHNGHLLIVQSCQAMRDYSNMLSYAAFAIQQKMDRTGEFYHYAGIASYELKGYDQAIVFLKKSIALDNYRVESYRYLGLSLQALGQNESAEIFLNKAELLDRSGKGHEAGPKEWKLAVY